MIPNPRLSAFVPIKSPLWRSKVHVSCWQIFVAKVGCCRWAVGHLVNGRFDPPTLTPLRNYNAMRWIEPEHVVAERPAMRAAAVLGNGSQNNLVLGASWSTQSKATEPQLRFRCANRISIFLRSRRDCSKPLGGCERPGNVSGRPTPYRRGSPDTPSPRGWISPSDPAAQWTSAHTGPAFFAFPTTT